MLLQVSQEPDRPEIREAAHALALIDQAQRVTIRHSLDNGVTLFVWGNAFLLDMIAFDITRLFFSVFPALIFMLCLNSAVVVWRLWYGRQSPIRLKKVLTNRILFWWSFYYIALLSLGVGGWILLIGSYPPFWFSSLGILGAFPLFINAIRQWRYTHQVA